MDRQIGGVLVFISAERDFYLRRWHFLNTAIFWHHQAKEWEAMGNLVMAARAKITKKQALGLYYAERIMANEKRAGKIR